MTQSQIPNPYTNNPTAPVTTPNVTPGPITGASPSALGVVPDARLAQAAETAQLSETLEHLPGGPDTILGERGINLSGGQKQRTAIARALAKSPPVFVLDDALSAVDAQTETRILQSLRSALAGRTSIIIPHRLAAAAPRPPAHGFCRRPRHGRYSAHARNPAARRSASDG